MTLCKERAPSCCRARIGRLPPLLEMLSAPAFSPSSVLVVSVQMSCPQGGQRSAAQCGAWSCQLYSVTCGGAVGPGAMQLAFESVPLVPARLRVYNDPSIFKKGRLPWWWPEERQPCMTPTLMNNLDTIEIFSQHSTEEAYTSLGRAAVAAEGPWLSPSEQTCMRPGGPGRGRGGQWLALGHLQISASQPSSSRFRVTEHLHVTGLEDCRLLLAPCQVGKRVKARDSQSRAQLGRPLPRLHLERRALLSGQSWAQPRRGRR